MGRGAGGASKVVETFEELDMSEQAWKNQESEQETKKKSHEVSRES